jgi:hypothetical protein
MSFYAVFHASNITIDSPIDFGRPVPHRDTFLGLYYPYWAGGFSRWYNVVYPTNEEQFRQGVAAAPYDYPLVLVNNDYYWGVGNYKAFVAIPAKSRWFFTYILTHELGHFFGLNEEYEGGGPTELEFAPGMEEPWSQNITFLKKPDYEHLKWHQFTDNHTHIPTPSWVWHLSFFKYVYGAYLGGYADSRTGHSYKPGFNCTMEAGKHFCPVCQNAIEEVIRFDVGGE